MSTINWPWAIILCRFSNETAEPQPIDYYEDLFAQNGTGGVCDYFRCVTCNTLDLSNSRVFGWFDSGHTAVEYAQLADSQHSASRGTVVQWGKQAATAAGVDLAPFRNVLVLFNRKTAHHDHGAVGAYPGAPVLILQEAAGACEFGFICHEMAHGLGLKHSWSANPDSPYGDGWDLMSWQTTQYPFNVTFRGTDGLATVGLNAHNLTILNALPPRRTWSPPRPDFSESIVLDPLGQSALGNHGFLVICIPPDATAPRRPDGSSYLVEFRRRAGWDQGIPRDAVLIHQVRTDGNSYVQPAKWTDFAVGDKFAMPDPKVFIQVMTIDGTAATATVRVWDAPEGSLRKEDTNAKVFLIDNGTKRWVTSPAVLFALGKSWSDVRTVPDGGLDTFSVGSDVRLLQVSVTPHPVALNRVAVITVHAKDLASGATVSGKVKVDGVAVADTNVAFSHTFVPKRVLIGTQQPRQWKQIPPSGVVVATGYPDAPIDFGFPNFN